MQTTATIRIAKTHQEELRHAAALRAEARRAAVEGLNPQRPEILRPWMVRRLTTRFAT